MHERVERSGATGASEVMSFGVYRILVSGRKGTSTKSEAMLAGGSTE